MAVNKTMLFGPIGAQVEVPWPQSGMGSDVNLYTETTQLLSGEQAVYRSPVSYRTYNMSWKGTGMKLQPIVDVYSGVYGNGPYYITDSLAGVQGTNLLPAKWAASHLLAHVCNGWSDPAVTTQTLTPEGKQVTFTGSADYTDEFPNPAVVPVIPGQPLYSKVWGSRTGSAGVRVYRFKRSTGVWNWDYTLFPTVTTTHLRCWFPRRKRTPTTLRQSSWCPVCQQDQPSRWLTLIWLSTTTGRTRRTSTDWTPRCTPHLRSSPECSCSLLALTLGRCTALEWAQVPCNSPAILAANWIRQ